MRSAGVSGIQGWSLTRAGNIPLRETAEDAKERVLETWRACLKVDK